MLFNLKKKKLEESSNTPDNGSFSKTNNIHIEKALNEGPSSATESLSSLSHPVNEKELRKLMWKIDLRIIPLVAILYLLSYLDRVNIGTHTISFYNEDI